MKNLQPSMAEALSEAHGAFLEDLRKLEQAARPHSGEAISDLLARLAEICSEVGEHFRFEEQNGYMNAIRKDEPRLERSIQQLEEEHRQLGRTLEALLTEVKAITGQDLALREKVRAWAERVRHHEARENQLVQDAFNRDLGAKD